jgi:hypothetical protein
MGELDVDGPGLVCVGGTLVAGGWTLPGCGSLLTRFAGDTTTVGVVDGDLVAVAGTIGMELSCGSWVCADTTAGVLGSGIVTTGGGVSVGTVDRFTGSVGIAEETLTATGRGRASPCGGNCDVLSCWVVGLEMVAAGCGRPVPSGIGRLRVGIGTPPNRLSTRSKAEPTASPMKDLSNQVVEDRRRPP